MLLSMTGFGESQSQRDRLAVSVEVRCINNRYFKLMTRSTEGYGPLDPRIELLVRDRIRRGSIQVNVRVDRVASADDYRLSEEVLEGYRRQLQAIQEAWGSRQPIDPLQLLMLPGVVHETAPAVTRGVIRSSPSPISIARTAEPAATSPITTAAIEKRTAPPLCL